MKKITNQFTFNRNLLIPTGRVYGGQLVAQSIRAAKLFIDSEGLDDQSKLSGLVGGVTYISTNFVTGGKLDQPVIYNCELVKVGKHYINLNITASQASHSHENGNPQSNACHSHENGNLNSNQTILCQSVLTIATAIMVPEHTDGKDQYPDLHNPHSVPATVPNATPTFSIEIPPYTKVPSSLETLGPLGAKIPPIQAWIDTAVFAQHSVLPDVILAPVPLTKNSALLNNADSCAHSKTVENFIYAIPNEKFERVISKVITSEYKTPNADDSSEKISNSDPLTISEFTHFAIDQAMLLPIFRAKELFLFDLSLRYTTMNHTARMYAYPPIEIIKNGLFIHGKYESFAFNRGLATADIYTVTDDGLPGELFAKASQELYIKKKS
ncbi:MAG: thioesterase family protein [Bifidobacteriaceae bacterium]|jgi:acyl-CoA thioesterase|nr:thioesterase family protein [Bifidobacteriaceae bacterium]